MDNRLTPSHRHNIKARIQSRFKSTLIAAHSGSSYSIGFLSLIGRPHLTFFLLLLAMSGGFFKGTSIDQDSRFPDKQKKLLAKMQFPHEYDEKVNLLPIRLELLRNWISQKVEGILGLEDEVVVDLIINSIEAAQKLARAGKKEGLLDPRELQITLTGFLEKQAKPFVLELWKMLLAAGQTSNGIAPQLLEETKAKILEAKNAQLIAAGLPPMTIATSTTTPTAAGTTVGETKPPRVSRFGPSPAVSNITQHTPSQHACNTTIGDVNRISFRGLLD